ncbi:MAG: excisionase [Mariprofundus sp.]|nr:excisionase [Mariprofundus sp.]
MMWVTIQKLSELMGYSENAIRAKIKKGIWHMNLHWRKAPDGRILFNPEAIYKWVEGR